ncbi:MAG: M48 family peptidase [Gammaproteobacteria bacterium]|nr:MAG: M48 family peptidase [Gammaproteobacteria bacterium]
MPLSFLKNLHPKNTSPLPFAFELVRSTRRRSISIEISKAQVVVRAPQFVARHEIEKFIHEKSAWVQQKLQQQELQLSAAPIYSFTPDSTLPYLGEPLTLVVHKQSKADVVRYGDKLLVILSSRARVGETTQIRRLVCGWYQQQAFTLLQHKTDLAVAKLGVRHLGITLKATRSKWGHCTARGAIQYNWQIMLAPEAVVDYLVAHEVSHLLHHNHSPAFWAVVEQLCPDYKKHRAWLKAHGAQLMF